MPDYRTPLPALLAGFLEAGVNRVLALDPASEQRLLKLQGKTLQLDLEGLDITLFLSFDSGNVRVGLDSDTEPDTLVRGTPVALFAMAAPGEAEHWGLPGSNVHIEGDANLARDLERLFSALEPDFEKPITDLLGDVLGFQVASGLKQGAEGMRAAAESTIKMAGSFFRDESETLVRPPELDEFNRAVDTLNDAIERLEARLRDLRGSS